MHLKLARTGGACFVALLVPFTATACVPMAENFQSEHFSVLNADPSLFAPPTDNQYLLHSETVEAKHVSHIKATQNSLENANGKLVITDGIMSSAVLIAQLDDFHEIKFELSEPVVFERKGQVADVIVCVGKLTTPSGVINDVKLILTPKVQGSKTLLNASIDVPESFSFGFTGDPTPLNFSLLLDPVTH